MTFADFTEYTPPVAIGSWLECLFWVVAIVTATVFLFRLIFPKDDDKLPQPLQVQYSQRLATHEELLQLRKEFEEYRRDQAAIVSDFRDRLDEIDDHVKSNPARVIALLKEAKGLWP